VPERIGHRHGVGRLLLLPLLLMMTMTILEAFRFIGATDNILRLTS
jgi:hypothetical protein